MDHDNTVLRGVFDFVLREQWEDLVDLSVPQGKKDDEGEVIRLDATRILKKVVPQNLYPHITVSAFELSLKKVSSDKILLELRKVERDGSTHLIMCFREEEGTGVTLLTGHPFSHQQLGGGVGVMVGWLCQKVELFTMRHSSEKRDTEE